MKPHILTATLLTILLQVLFPAAAWSQTDYPKRDSGDTVTYDNRYQIRDDLFRIYRRAETKRSSEECIAIADTLLEQSILTGDKKAECLAHVLKMNYYLNIKDENRLQAEAIATRETSRRNGFMQYYYYAYSQEINLYLSSNRLLQAKDLIEIMNNEAVADNDYYGQALSLMQNGKLYQQRVNYSKASEYYSMAAEMYEQKVPSQTPVSAYTMASDVSLRIRDFDNALTYAEKGLAYEDNDPKTQIQLLNHKAMALFGLKRYAEFSSVHREIIDFQNVAGVNGRKLSLSYYPLWEAYNGRYEEALHLAKEVKSVGGYIISRMIREYMHDYQGAMAETDTLQQLTIENYSLAIDEDLNAMSIRIGNEQLKLENARLTVEKEIKDAEFRRSIMLGSIIASLLIILILSTYLINRIRDSRRIREQNRLLQIANEEAVKARNRAERSEKIQSAFIQNMSHEIRTPLNAIVGFSQLLADPGYSGVLTEDEKLEYSELIRNNTGILTSLVSDILNLADIESGQLKTDISEFGCNDVCRNAISEIRSYIKKGVEVSFGSEVDDSFKLISDRYRVEQVLSNLLSNACKFTEEGEVRLFCSLSETPGMMTISVADSGPGIPPEKAEEIFERFTKLDSFKQGNGLGLSICRLLASTIGGEVMLDTTYSDGARFKFVIPLKTTVL